MLSVKAREVAADTIFDVFGMTQRSRFYCAFGVLGRNKLIN